MAKPKSEYQCLLLDLGSISIVSLGPRASTKVEFNVNFTESLKVSKPVFFFILLFFFFAVLNTKKLAKTIN